MAEAVSTNASIEESKPEDDFDNGKDSDKSVNLSDDDCDWLHMESEEKDATNVNDDNNTGNSKPVKKDFLSVLTKKLEDNVEFKRELGSQLLHSMMHVVIRHYKNAQKLCDNCSKNCPFSTDHVIPDDLLFFDGSESLRLTKKWLATIETNRQMKGWTDEFTIEVARYYLVNEALAWEELNLSEVTKWTTWMAMFKKRFYIKDYDKSLSVDNIYQFFNYREAIVVEVYARRVVIPKNVEFPIAPEKKISENPFETFASHTEHEKRRLGNLDANFGNEVSDDGLHLFIVIKTRVKKVTFSEMMRTKYRLLGGTAVTEKHGKGAFAELLTVVQDKNAELNDEKCYYYCWTEWWMQLYLKKRITTKRGNTKLIKIGTQTVKGYIDLFVEHSTIKQSVALQHGFKIIEEEKTIENYEGTECISTGYFYENVIIKTWDMRGRAKWLVVPDDSQSVDVILGRSLTKFPLVYRDDDYTLGEKEVKHRLEECPELEYPRLESFKELGEIYM